jgi:hypothetical protein
MVSKSPWSVKGVSQEDRDQAKTAARRAGLQVGVWLSQTIRSFAERESSEPTKNADGSKAEAQARGAPWRVGPTSRFTFSPGQWSIATDGVEDGRIFQPPPQPIVRSPVMAPPQPVSHPMYIQEPSVQRLVAPMVDYEEMEVLDKKIESLKASLEAVGAKLARQAASFEQRLGKMVGCAQEVDELRMAINHDAERTYSTASVERAVMRLSEQLQRVEDAVLPAEPRAGFFSRLFRHL